MLKKILTLSITMNALALSNAWAIDQMWAKDQAGSRQETQGQEPVYGGQLMTEQERAEYRENIRASANEEEREKIRKEHHKLMQQRAHEHGVTLPDEPRDDMEHDGHH